MLRHVDLLVWLALAACGGTQGQTDDDGVPIDAASGAPAPIDGASNDGAKAPTPKLRWSFEQNLDNDGVLAGYPLTQGGLGVAAFVPGKVGATAYGMHDQRLSVTNMHQTLATYSKLTIAFWLKESGNLDTKILSCYNRSTSPYGGAEIFIYRGSVIACAASTTNRSLPTGSTSCDSFSAPSANTWHHWIVRYDGSGLSAGQGATTTIYIDGNLAYTIANDSNNNPVWNPGIPNEYLIDGFLAATETTGLMSIDELQVWDRVFTPAEQCTLIVGGTFDGEKCTPP